MSKFHVSTLATEATLANGRPLARGTDTDLSKSEIEDPFNARLIAEGQLIPVTEAAEKSARAVVKEVSS